MEKIRGERVNIFMSFSSEIIIKMKIRNVSSFIIIHLVFVKQNIFVDIYNFRLSVDGR